MDRSVIVIDARKPSANDFGEKAGNPLSHQAGNGALGRMSCLPHPTGKIYGCARVDFNLVVSRTMINLLFWGA